MPVLVSLLFCFLGLSPATDTDLAEEIETRSTARGWMRGQLEGRAQTDTIRSKALSTCKDDAANEGGDNCEINATSMPHGSLDHGNHRRKTKEQGRRPTCFRIARCLAGGGMVPGQTKRVLSETAQPSMKAHKQEACCSSWEHSPNRHECTEATHLGCRGGINEPIIVILWQARDTSGNLG